MKAICEVDGKWASELLGAFREHHEVDDNFVTQNSDPWTATIAGPDDCPVCTDCLVPSTCHGTAPDLTIGKN